MPRTTPADDAARALEPLAGPYAKILFGLGLFGAGMRAASVLPLSTAYAICGAGVSYRWRQAPVFNGLCTVLIVLAAALADDAYLANNIEDESRHGTLLFTFGTMLFNYGRDGLRAFDPIVGAH